MSTDKDLHELSARIDDLVQRVELIGDPAVRANVVTLIQSLLELHQRGFSRLADLLQQNREGAEILRSLSSDELVGGLLVLYGLHPDGIENRIRRAVSKISVQMASSKSSVELLELNEGVVRILLKSAASGCSSGTGDIEEMIRDTIYSEAPDVERVEIERVSAGKAGADALVQLQIAPAVP